MAHDQRGPPPAPLPTTPPSTCHMELLTVAEHIMLLQISWVFLHPVPHLVCSPTLARLVTVPCPPQVFTFSVKPPRLPFFLFFFLNFIYLFMAVLGLCFCARAFSSCGKWGPLFIVVRGPLTIVASLVAEHTLQTRRLSNCGSRA